MLVKDLIEKIPSDTHARVKQANRRYNQIIREAIRSETRLKLKPNGSTRGNSVPVQVDAVGYPEEIGHRIISGRNKLAAILSLFGTSLIKLRDSSMEIGEFLNPGKDHRLNNLSKYVLESLPEIAGSCHSVLVTREIAGRLLRESQEFNIVEDIFSVDHDILGAYIYDYSDNGSSKIKLYWGVIGLFANALGLEAEDVTAMVMAHELAHAYTHQGFDIDQNRWDSELFYDSDPALKEGLAQYYTAKVMESLQVKIPGGFKAYEELLENQPEVYHKHLPWIEKSTPESVRNALILLRSKSKPVKLKIFENVLNKITPNYKRNLMN